MMITLFMFVLFINTIDTSTQNKPLPSCLSFLRDGIGEPRLSRAVPFMEAYKNYSLNSMNGEKWRDVENTKGAYSVSNYGRVRSNERKEDRIRFTRRGIKQSFPYTQEARILKQGLYKRFGYLYVHLKSGVDKKIKVHRLVAFAFIKEVKGKSCVNHKDGDKKNNHYLNLEWCTQRENILHAYKNGFKRPSKNCYNHKRGNSPRAIKIGVLDEHGKIIREYSCMNDFYEAEKVSWFMFDKYEGIKYLRLTTYKTQSA